MSDPGPIQIIMYNWLMTDADKAAGADAETIGLAAAITQCRIDSWLLEFCVVQLARIRLLTSHLLLFVTHSNMRIGFFSLNFETRWLRWVLLACPLPPT